MGLLTPEQIDALDPEKNGLDHASSFSTLDKNGHLPQTQETASAPFLPGLGEKIPHISTESTVAPSVVAAESNSVNVLWDEMQARRAKTGTGMLAHTTGHLRHSIKTPSEDGRS